MIASPRILREKRRTLSITIQQDHVVIKAPYSANIQLINDFAKKHQQWIYETQALLQQKQWFSIPQIINIDDDINCFLFGDLYSFHCTIQPKPHKNRVDICHTSKRITINANQKRQLNKLIRDYLINALQDYVVEQVNFYASQLKKSIRSIVFKAYKSRWGTCSSSKDLSFNTALLHFPKDIIRYVIIHECCHLIHFNHSSSFWKLVEQFQSSYPACKAYLRKYQCMIS
jgi:predicted metal-dependent hydrolase